MTRLISFILLSAFVCMLAQAGPLPAEKVLEKKEVEMIGEMQKLQSDVNEDKKFDEVVRKNAEVDKKIWESSAAVEAEMKKLAADKKDVDEAMEKKVADKRDQFSLDGVKVADKKDAQLEEDKKVDAEKKDVQLLEEIKKVDTEKKSADMKVDEDKKKADAREVEVQQVESTTVRVVEREAESTSTVESTTTTVESTTVAVPVVAADEQLSLNTSSWAQNPCEARGNFNYYQSYPNDATRYIQCDPWGTGVVRQCEAGTVWNMWALKCDASENVRNLTFAMPQRVFNCSAVGYECMNSGVCSESALGGFKCVCRPEFTGQFCENKVDTSDLTHEILNGTFSLAAFRQKLAELNISSDAAQYERYRDQLDNRTFAELHAYVSMYNRTDVRYDTLVNNLIEAVLESIYPDAAYLSSFNASSISVVELVRLIPNLLSYSRYSLERYHEVFSKYQSVLGSLVQQLNATEPRLRQESVQYSRLTAIFMNQTLALMNQTISSSNNVNSLLETQQQQQPARTQMSEEQIREQLRQEYNVTLRATERLYEKLERFQAGVLKQLESNPEVYRQTLAECRIEGAVEVQRMLETVSSSSVQIWDSLVNYGFWFVTSILSTPAHVLAQEQAAVQAVVAAAQQVESTTVAPRV